MPVNVVSILRWFHEKHRVTALLSVTDRQHIKDNRCVKVYIDLLSWSSVRHSGIKHVVKFHSSCKSMAINMNRSGLKTEYCSFKGGKKQSFRLQMHSPCHRVSCRHALTQPFFFNKNVWTKCNG
jgi:hypothetical protein